MSLFRNFLCIEILRDLITAHFSSVLTVGVAISVLSYCSCPLPYSGGDSVPVLEEDPEEDEYCQEEGCHDRGPGVVPRGEGGGGGGGGVLPVGEDVGQLLLHARSGHGVSS